MPRLTDSRVSAIKPPSGGQEEHADDLVRGLRLRVSAGGRKAWIVRTRAGKKQVNKTLGSYPLISLATARDMAREFLIGIAREGELRPKRTFGDPIAWLSERYNEREYIRAAKKELQMIVG